MSTTPEQCFTDLRELAHRYCDALGDDCGESVHHAIATTLLALSYLPDYCKTGYELRVELAKSLSRLAGSYLESRKSRAEVTS